MKERPILFSAHMVKAILENRKTETRRVVKTQPVLEDYGSQKRFVYRLKNKTVDRTIFIKDDGLGSSMMADDCPYGKVGDRLWVRETWAMAIKHGESYRSERVPHYLADGDRVPKWKPPIFMPRWASRITLEITEVSANQLQMMSALDARSEGIEKDLLGTSAEMIRDFSALWDSINGKKAPWDSNPWVWVIKFRQVQP